MVKADFVTGIALIVLSLYVIIESWRMPRLEHLKVHPLSVPGIVPAFIASVLFIFGAVLFIRSIRNGGYRMRITAASLKKVWAHPGNQRLIMTAILTIGYAGFLIGKMPYGLATSIFILAFIILFEGKRDMNFAQWRRCLISAILIASISAIAITLIFERLFLVTLP